MSDDTKDTTYYIWDVQWRCKIPQLQTTDEDYIRHFGMPTSMSPDIDRELAKQWIDTMLPIATMVDYHRRGIPVKVVHFDDVEKIYHYIELHLQGWVNNLKNNLNIGDVPVEDLMAMNEFANSIYPYAKNYFKDTDIGSSFMRSISQLGFNDLSSRFKPVEKEDNKRVQQRKDLSDVFKNVRSGVGRWT